MTSMYPSWLTGLCCMLFLLTASCQPSAPAVLDASTRAAVVKAAARALREGYVYPEVGDKTAQALEDSLSAGRYDTIIQPLDFARRLTADMSDVAHDLHMKVFLTERGDGPGGPGAPNEYGVGRADLLPGQIGYLELIAFPPAGLFKGPIDRAMAGLAGTQALIIDARRNGGGDPTGEAYMLSYFLPKRPAPVVVDRFVWRRPGTRTFRTEDFPSSPTPFSYAGKPVYVLTSSHTFSGGEAFVYGMQAMHLSTTIGETTGGGANPGGPRTLAAGFSMVLPRGRSSNPVTGTNWEGVGVKPDIAVPATDALKVALERLGQHPVASDIGTLSQKKLFTPHVSQP